jgi:hypothetical protein
VKLDGLTTATRPLGLGAAIFAVASVVFAIAAEVGSGGMTAEISRPLVIAAGACALVGSVLLLVSLIALYLSTYDRASAGIPSFIALVIGAGLSVGAAWSLAFVVPALVDRAPGLVNNPPASIPLGYIVSYAILGIAAVVFGVKLKRSGVFSTALSVLFIIGGVICITPLPGRFFLLAIATARMLWVLDREPARSRSLASQTV